MCMAGLGISGSRSTIRRVVSVLGRHREPWVCFQVVERRGGIALFTVLCWLLTSAWLFCSSALPLPAPARGSLCVRPASGGTEVAPGLQLSRAAG